MVQDFLHEQYNYHFPNNETTPLKNLSVYLTLIYFRFTSKPPEEKPEAIASAKEMAEDIAVGGSEGGLLVNIEADVFLRKTRCQFVYEQHWHQKTGKTDQPFYCKSSLLNHIQT